MKVLKTTPMMVPPGIGLCGRRAGTRPELGFAADLIELSGSPWPRRAR
jgi:hypothetical protein